MSKILILTNHSYMLYRFRLELIQALMKSHEVVLSMPFVLLHLIVHWQQCENCL